MLTTNLYICACNVFQVLTNVIEVKLHRNALSVIEPPTCNEGDDDFEFETGNSVVCSGTKWIFVMSAAKRLYIDEKKGKLYHLSFLAGGTTLDVGQLTAKRGLIKAKGARLEFSAGSTILGNVRCVVGDDLLLGGGDAEDARKLSIEEPSEPKLKSGARTVSLMVGELIGWIFIGGRRIWLGKLQICELG